MGVGIDQPGDEQPVGRVDAAGVVADALARRQHRNDRVVFDQDIGMLTAEPPGGREHGRHESIVSRCHPLHHTGVPIPKFAIACGTF